MKYLIIPLILLISACSQKVELPSEAQRKLYSCKDLRDGEEFHFWGTEVNDVRIEVGLGYKEYCFMLKDTNGKRRDFCTSSRYPDYLKCTY